jgi:hypothetical protein
MHSVGGVYKLWAFTLIRCDSAVNKNIRRIYLHSFLFEDYICTYNREA